MTFITAKKDLPCGTIINIEPNALWIATGNGVLKVYKVQLEGKKAMTVRDFLRGHRNLLGSKLG